MKVLLFLVPLALSSFGHSQANTKVAQTSGSCSPVITGGSSQVTIHCAGLSSEKANQMIKLMNGILARQMDISELDSQLGHIQTELASLRQSVNPIANATPAQKAIIDQGYLAYSSCITFMTDSMQHRTDSMKRSQTDQSIQAAQQNQPYVDAFSKNYLPKLEAMEVRYRQPGTDDGPVPDHSRIESYTDAQRYMLYVQGLQRKTLRGGAIQPSAYQQMKTDGQVFMDASQFIMSWLQAASRPHLPVSAPSPGELDPADLTRYKITIEPRLVAFRDKIQPLVPAYASNRSYDVADVSQLNGVCMDVSTLGSAYLRKITNNSNASITQGPPQDPSASPFPSPR